EQGETVFMTAMKAIFSSGTRRNGLHDGVENHFLSLKKKNGLHDTNENHFLFRNKEKRSSRRG
ncbi:hypothetical protein, partial [Bacillus dakarensis]|uniref:hypothetical protein n=1 Tax=Robertmurraya dakarensis TaxID=1926278 RepID=UPI001F2F27F5